MSIAPYLKEIGRGKAGARDLSPAQAEDLMARLLDGQVSDLERGGFALAMRIKGESPEELAGFMAAVLPRLVALPPPRPDQGGAVVLPSYNGARKLPNLTPLLAGLLARAGVPVLVHGFDEDPARVTTAQVFAALGWPRAEGPDDVARAWSAHQPVFMPLEALHPSLATLLRLRQVLGLRNPGHTLAKLLPAVPGGVRVVNHTHPEYADSLARFLALTRADALLMRGTEGEPVADPRRLPALKVFVAGQWREDLGAPAQQGPLTEVPELPGAIDAQSTARWTEDLLAGQRPLPAPLLRQVQVLQALRRARLDAA